MSYIYPSVQIPLGLLSVDYSIHGIEITEGIQCFKPSQGLTTCPDNSVPLVTKKDAAARIYLKVGSGSVNNVPVRLYLRANNVWYQVDSTGKATTAINQGAAESANVYFNVNFGSTVAVDFYAVVDPNNLLTESNEGNNRYPAVGYITLNFTLRRSMTIVGDRLRYHPSGYGGTQYAGGSNDGNSNFPYGTSSIQEFGFNPITGKIYDPALTHDLMSYCPSGGSKLGWIAPFTWTMMFNKLTPPPFPPEPTKAEDVSFIIPWVDGTTQVVLTHLGEVIDSRPVSANPPQVKITSPLEQETWLPKSSHSLTWEGTDTDGDPLIYSIFYSHNGGATWIIFDTELTGTSRLINTDEMAGGSDTRFRVVATDGVNTGFDETDQAITIPNQAPQALILNPENGSSFLPGSLVVLEGIGTDMEDGTLPDDALSWSSDVQGSLGIGPSLPLNVLSFGTHQITLMVKDSYGIPSTYSVRIQIAYRTHLPALLRP